MYQTSIEPVSSSRVKACPQVGMPKAPPVIIRISIAFPLNSTTLRLLACGLAVIEPIEIGLSMSDACAFIGAVDRINKATNSIDRISVLEHRRSIINPNWRRIDTSLSYNLMLFGLQIKGEQATLRSACRSNKRFQAPFRGAWRADARSLH